MLIPLGILGSSKAAPVSTATFELISTINIDWEDYALAAIFDSIPQTYKHLQIRFSISGSSDYNYDAISLMINDTDIPYPEGQPSYSQYGSVIDTYAQLSEPLENSVSITGNLYQMGYKPYSGIVDILEYTSTSKWKMAKALTAGQQINNGVEAVMTSLAFTDLNPITSIALVTGGGFNYARVSLYGIRG